MVFKGSLALPFLPGCFSF